MLPEEVIIRPVITEKSNDEMQAGKYTFEVNKKATKVDVAKAVEKLFEVKVLNVNTMTGEVVFFKDTKVIKEFYGNEEKKGKKKVKSR